MYLNKKTLLILLSLALLVLANNDDYVFSKDFGAIFTEIKDDTMYFTIKTFTFGYFGIGFGKSMTETDMIFSVINQDGSLEVSDTYSFGHRTPTLDEKLTVPGKNDIVNTKIEPFTDKNYKYKVTFERKLNTEDKNDYIVNRDSIIDIIISWKKEQTTGYHNGYIFLNAIIPGKENSNQSVTYYEAVDNFYVIEANFVVVSAWLSPEKKDRIVFNFVFYTWGFVGISFDHANMIKSDLIIVETPENFDEKDLKITDRYSFDQSFPSLDTELGGKNDILNIRLKKDDGYRIVSFERYLNTTDKYDAKLELPTKGEIKYIDVTFAWTQESKLTHHSNTKKCVLRIDQNQNLTFLDEAPKNDDYVFSEDFGAISTEIKDDTMYFTIKTLTFGYFGIGFGKSMTETDMIFSVINKDGSLEVSDTYSFGHRTPTRDEKLTVPGKNDILNTKIEPFTDKNYKYKVTFERKLNTEDKNDYIVNRDSIIDIVISWKKEKTTGYHDGYIFLNAIIPGKENSNQSVTYNKAVDYFYLIEEGYVVVSAWLSPEKKDRIVFNFFFSTWGFVGISFDHSNMINSDLIIVETPDNFDEKDLKITDRYSFDKSFPSLDTELGGKNDILNIRLKKDDGYSIVSFERYLDTTDKYDTKLELPTKGEIKYIDVTFAWTKESKLTHHSNTKKCVLKVDQNQILTFLDEAPKNDDYVFSEDFGAISTIIKDDTMYFTIKTFTFGYFGIGFGKSMTETDMIFSVINQDGTLEVSDTYSFGHGTPTLDEKLTVPGKNDIVNTKIEPFTDKNYKYKVTFERKLNTEDKNDYIVNRDSIIDVIISWKKEHTTGYHNGYKISSAIIPGKVNSNQSVTYYEAVDNSYVLDKEFVKVSAWLSPEKKDRIIFNLIFSTWGFVGISFDHARMIKSDLIIVETLENFDVKDLKVTDRYSFDQSFPSLDTELGGKNDILNIRLKKEKGYSVVNFERYLDTTDKYDTKLELPTKGEIKFIDVTFAWTKESKLTHHSNTKNCVLKVDQNQILTFLDEAPKNDDYVFSEDFGAISTIIKDDTMYFTIKTFTFGYFGIGFGKSMTETDMIFSVINQDGTLEVSDTYSFGHGTPTLDEKLTVPGKNDIVNTKIEPFTDKNYKYKVTFERKLNTEDKNDYIVNRDSIIDIIISWKKEQTTGYHNGYKISSAIIPSKESSNQSITYYDAVYDNYVVDEDFLAVNTYLSPTNNNKIIFNFIFFTWGFAGIQFSHSKMENSDIILVEMNQNNEAKVSDRYALTLGPPKTDESLGGTNDITGLVVKKDRLQIKIKDSYVPKMAYIVTFQRLIDTKDKYDKQIELPELGKSNNLDISFAWSKNKDFSHHEHTKKSILIINEKRVCSIKDSSPDPPKPDKDYGITIDDYFRIEATLNHNKQVIIFKLSFLDYGYVGFLFGSNMDNTDTIVVDISKDGVLNVSDRTSKGHEEPILDEKLGGKNDINNAQIKVLESKNDKINYKYEVTFERNLITEDALDFKIQTIEELIKTNPKTSGKQNFSLAWKKNSELSFHGDNIKVTHIAVSTKENIVSLGETPLPDSGGDDPKPEPKDNFYDFHGIIQTIVWTFFTVPSIIIIRHFKHLYWAKYVHFAGSGITSLSSIYFSAAAILSHSSLPKISINNPRSYHLLLGFIIVFLILIQFIAGIVIFLIIYFSNPKTNLIHQIKVLHKILGFLLTIVSYSMIITGFIIHFRNTLYVAIIIVVLFPVIFIAFEFYFNYVLNKSFKGKLAIEKIYDNAYDNLQTYNSNEINELISTSLNQERQSIKREGLINSKFSESNNNSERTKLIVESTEEISIVFYDNLICNVNSFIKNHPGSAELLNANLTKDISRYISGTYPGNSNYHSHKHKNQTIIYLIKELAIGKISEDHKLVVDEKMNSIYINYKWNSKISEISTIAKDTYKVNFNVFFDDIDAKFAVELKGIEFFGKHYSIYSKTLNKTRYYSICLALNNQNNNYHLNLLNKQLMKFSHKEKILFNDDNVNNIVSNKAIENKKIISQFIDENESENYNKNLSFYFKRYQDCNSMSFHLTKHELIGNSNEFIINGPLGRGLGFNKNTVLDGVYVIISGGTGIFSFLDFIYYTLRYIKTKISVVEEPKSKNKNLSNDSINEDGTKSLMSESEKSNEKASNEIFQIGNKFKLILFSSFADEETAIQHDFFKGIQKLNNFSNLNIFNYHARFSNKDKFRFSEDYLRDKIPTQAVTKAFVSGPSKMTEEIISILKYLKLENKIYEV